MTVPRHIGGEHPDLTVRDLTRRARVLSRNSARGLALLQKAGFVDDKNSVSIGQRFLCILTHHIAQCIGISSSSAQDPASCRNGETGNRSRHVCSNREKNFPTLRSSTPTYRKVNGGKGRTASCTGRGG